MDHLLCVFFAQMLTCSFSFNPPSSLWCAHHHAHLMGKESGSERSPCLPRVLRMVTWQSWHLSLHLLQIEYFLLHPRPSDTKACLESRDLGLNPTLQPTCLVTPGESFNSSDTHLSACSPEMTTCLVKLELVGRNSAFRSLWATHVRVISERLMSTP